MCAYAAIEPEDYRSFIAGAIMNKCLLVTILVALTTAAAAQATAKDALIATLPTGNIARPPILDPNAGKSVNQGKHQSLRFVPTAGEGFGDCAEVVARTGE